MKRLILIVSLFTGTVFAAGIANVSPNIAGAGETLSVTMALDPSATPPVPPANVAPGNMTVGEISGSNISRSDYDCTAMFVIPADEASGAKGCTVAFDLPGVTYAMTDGFTVTGGTELVVGRTATNQQPAAGSYPIVDTGQTNFYNTSTTISAPATNTAFYGQDAQVVGRQPSYTVSGDGLTVYDNVTGLTWTRSHDWDGDGDLDAGDKMTQTDALLYADTLNSTNYGGYSDWRLPSSKELYSLMDFRGTDPNLETSDTSGLRPFIDNTVFDVGYGDTAAGERLIDSQFAVTTIYMDTVMEGQEAMFGLNFVDGRIKGYPTQTGKEYYAYYCRGNTSYAVNDFKDNGNGTVTDNATGLMWAQADCGTSMDWEAALAYAETNNLAGYDDWRLPNAKELQSLVDYTRSPGTTASAAIDPLFSATQITNMAGEQDFPWYWSGTTHLKSSGSAEYGVYICFGRGMGTMDGGDTIIDVHGAGCQRSDPKTGAPDDYPNAGNGPQGDVSRVFNYVRLVRDVSGDSDGDGITDDDELNVHGTNPNLPDTDGDRMNDGDEVFAGTEPTNSNSVFRITMNESSVSWPSASNRTYTLMQTTNLVSPVWSTNAIYGSPTSSVQVPMSGERLFYRLKVTTQ